jgi:hypothetical protein
MATNLLDLMKTTIIFYMENGIVKFLKYIHNSVLVNFSHYLLTFLE